MYVSDYNLQCHQYSIENSDCGFIIRYLEPDNNDMDRKQCIPKTVFHLTI